MKRLVLLALVVIVLAASPLTIYAAFQSNENPTVLPPNSRPYGMSYGEWGAEWWIWATKEPSDNSPLFDDDGSFCTVGQSGQVWFLAGTFGGTVERECSVPAGKALFFPIVNGLSWAPEFGTTEAEIRADVAADLAGINVLEASVDGVELKNLFGYRAASPAFTLPIAEGSLLTEFGLEPGDRYPAVSDGWWLMLTPLSRGEHVIHFQGAGTNRDGSPFSLDVTYNLTVGP